MPTPEQSEAIGRWWDLRSKLAQAMTEHCFNDPDETIPFEMSTVVLFCAEAAANFIEPRPTERYTTARWKYAEERAHRLIEEGKLIRISMSPSVRHVDEGDVVDGIDPPHFYIRDEFHVDVIGERGS